MFKLKDKFIAYLLNSKMKKKKTTFDTVQVKKELNSPKTWIHFLVL